MKFHFDGNVEAKGVRQVRGKAQMGFRQLALPPHALPPYLNEDRLDPLGHFLDGVLGGMERLPP